MFCLKSGHRWLTGPCRSERPARLVLPNHISNTVYFGPRPLRDLETVSTALNSILCFTESHCKDLRLRVMCSLFFVFVSILAAAL